MNPKNYYEHPTYYIYDIFPFFGLIEIWSKDNCFFCPHLLVENCQIIDPLMTVILIKNMRWLMSVVVSSESVFRVLRDFEGGVSFLLLR